MGGRLMDGITIQEDYNITSMKEIATSKSPTSTGSINSSAASIRNYTFNTKEKVQEHRERLLKLTDGNTKVVDKIMADHKAHYSNGKSRLARNFD